MGKNKSNMMEKKPIEVPVWAVYLGRCVQMFFAFFYAKRVLARATKGSRDDKKPTDAGLTRVSGTSGVLSCNYRLFFLFLYKEGTS